jgi:hypothetical protein
LEDLGVDERNMLNGYSKHDKNFGTGFIWLRIRISGSHFEHGTELSWSAVHGKFLLHLNDS